MKSVLVTTLVVLFAGCVDGEAPDAAGERDARATIDRFTSDGAVIQSYTPNEAVIVSHESGSALMTYRPADREAIDQFYKVVDEVGASVGSGGISCSSRDRKQDCFCSTNCCRDESTCHCC